MESKKLVPYSVILAAKNGDPEAMNEILAHFDKLIDFHSSRTIYDEYGNSHSTFDSEIKHQIQAKILDKIIHEFDPYSFPPGETLER